MPIPNSIRKSFLNFLDNLLNKTTWNKDGLNHQNYINQTEPHVSIWGTTQGTKSTMDKFIMSANTSSTQGHHWHWTLNGFTSPARHKWAPNITYANISFSITKKMAWSGSTDNHWTCQPQKKLSLETLLHSQEDSYGQEVPIYVGQLHFIY